jgi:transposase
LRTLARRWEYLNDETAALDAQLDELTEATAPTPRAINGVGSQVATTVLAAAGDNPSRLRSSFAALCGVSPIDASSGRQQHHRLNRDGDRHANWALHMIIISRLLTRRRRPTWPAGSPRNAPTRWSCAASNDTSHERSTAPSTPTSASTTPRLSVRRAER